MVLKTNIREKTGFLCSPAPPMLTHSQLLFQTSTFGSVIPTKLLFPWNILKETKLKQEQFYSCRSNKEKIETELV